MTDHRGFERAVDDWLAEGSDRSPQPAVDAVLLAIKTTPQERDLRMPWRNQTMPAPMRLAAGIAIVAVLGFAGLTLLNPGTTGVGGLPAATPTPASTPTPSPTPSATPSATPSGTDGPIDTATWTTYTSSQYGFTIGHPDDWTVKSSDRPWDLDTDAADWLSPAMEDFTSPIGDVRVSAWAVRAAFGSTVAGLVEVEAWIEDYCQKANETPCAGIPDRAVPLCLERRDCHPGLLVPFEEDVLAFFTNGAPGSDLIIVAVWRPEIGSNGPSIRWRAAATRILPRLDVRVARRCEAAIRGTDPWLLTSDTTQGR